MSEALAESIDNTVHEEIATLVLENGTHTPMEQSYSIEQLDIGSILIPDTVRAVSEHLDMLKASIRTIGLLHPITVKLVKQSSYELLSGHNRLEAVKQLGSVVENDTNRLCLNV